MVFELLENYQHESATIEEATQIKQVCSELRYFIYVAYMILF